MGYSPLVFCIKRWHQTGWAYRNWYFWKNRRSRGENLKTSQLHANIKMVDRRIDGISHVRFFGDTIIFITVILINFLILIFFSFPPNPTTRYGFFMMLFLKKNFFRLFFSPSLTHHLLLISNFRFQIIFFAFSPVNYFTVCFDSFPCNGHWTFLALTALNPPTSYAPQCHTSNDPTDCRAV